MKSRLIALFIFCISGALADECNDVKTSTTILPSGYVFENKMYNNLYKSEVIDLKAMLFAERLIRGLEKKGTKVVFAIIPDSPDLSNRNSQLYKSYLANVIAPFEKIGAYTPDILKPMIEFSIKNPYKFLRLNRDVHWSPTGSQIAASVVANYIKTTFPSLELPKEDVKLVAGNNFRKNDGYLEKILHDKCPSLVNLTGEDIKTFDISLANSDLLDEINPEVVLIGTSFSAQQNHYSFDKFLEYNLQTPIVNEAIDGGGPLGGFLNYFSGNNTVFPKVLIWEIPTGHFNDKINTFSELYFKQAIPLIADSEKIRSTSMKNVAGNTVSLNIESAPNDFNGFVEVKLNSVKVIETDIWIEFADHTDGPIRLIHDHLNNHDDFKYEMYFTGIPIKSIRVGVPGAKDIGDITVSLHSYK